MNNEFEGDIFGDYELRESIIREMSEQELWETPETLPEDLLEDFWGNHPTKCHTTPQDALLGGHTIFIPNEATLETPEVETPAEPVEAESVDATVEAEEVETATPEVAF